MRLNINLASQKYEDVRLFQVRSGITLAVTLIVTLGLALLTWADHASSAASGQRISDLRQKIATLQKERATAEAIENAPENRDVTEQKNFWNAQISRRAFSWTQLFNELQRMMPGRAYVVSVSPELTKDNRLKLKLIIAGEKKDNALELVRKMESSQRFRQPQLLAESPQSSAQPGAIPVYKFDIETYYNPPPVTPGKVPRREGM